MARKRKSKKRGRPKKSKFTYDSQEFKFILGLLTIALAIITFLSYVLTDDEGVFRMLRSLFGEASFLFAFFLLNLAIFFFGGGKKYPLAARKAVIGQGLIVVLFSIYVAAIAEVRNLETLSYSGEYGGIIGFEIADFSEEHFLLNLTAAGALIVAFFTLPLAINQNLAQFFGNIFTGLSKAIAFMTGKNSKSKQDSAKKDKDTKRSEEDDDSSALPSMFSHFRKNDKSDAEDTSSSSDAISDSSTESSSDSEAAGKKPAPEFVGISSRGAGNSHEESSQPASSSGSGDSDNGDEEGLGTGLDFPDWKLPNANLLNPIPKLNIPKEDVENNSLIIEQTLQSFGIESKVMDVMVGPSVTQYALDLALGIKVSKINNLKSDLALALATSEASVRIEVPIPGTSYLGIEIPNSKRRPVFFRELVEDGSMEESKYKLPVSVGKDISGESVVGDIQKMPHLLIAGATGSGKSVLTNSFIMSLLMKRSPDEVRFILVDPKQVELSDYNGIPHLLTPVIVDMDKVVNALKWAVEEMEKRYTLFREERVRSIEDFNEKKGYSAIPYIVIVIDEMADMMLTSNRQEIENSIVRLAQKARATGIHLILATQRPSVNVITGIIKANIPGRIGMSVTTNADSRVILDYSGAESLLGKGDMLYKEPDKTKAARVQGVFVAQEEVQSVVKWIREQTDEESVDYIDDVTVDKQAQAEAAGAVGSSSGDENFAEAVQLVVGRQKGSASMLQRKLSVGYNRAAKLIDEMEELGIVGPPNGSKPREVLITDAESFLSSLAEGAS